MKWLFCAECIVGQGGTSKVYKGCLANGKELAVKILKCSDEVLKEFISEIEIVSSLNHKSIISIIGFSFKDNDLLLVYEYLQRGSLEEILHGISISCITYFLHVPFPCKTHPAVNVM
jgi:serine/threonine protein kinase